MIKLSVIIVSYNSKEFLKKCLESIPKTDAEVIVVDNDSKDGSADFVKEKFPNVILITNKKNVGFSKANNIGINKSKGEYVLFLNPDTIISKNSLDKIVKFMEENKDAGASTCKVLLENGQIDDASHRGFPTPWRSFCYFFGLSKLFPKSKIFAGYTMGWKDLDKTHEIDALAGAFMLVRRTAGQEAGWWDEDFFFYGEDLDFCFELKKRGWKVYYFPSVSILHYKGISSGIKKHSNHISLADIETKKTATVARFDAMKIFYKKHYEKKYPAAVNLLIYKAINLKFWLTLKSL